LLNVVNGLRKVSPKPCPLEAEFGDLLPAMNAGQIYSTLARLERDGLVSGDSVPGDSRGKRVYQLTEAGRVHLDQWIKVPVPGARLKDEFFMRFVIATSVGLAQPKNLIDRQRREYLQSMRDLDAAAAGAKSSAAQLMVEGAVLHLKADLAWLDLIEERLSRTASHCSSTRSTPCCSSSRRRR
jgi:DNA-binding PadR family transcriptional regulator